MKNLDILDFTMVGDGGVANHAFRAEVGGFSIVLICEQWGYSVRVGKRGSMIIEQIKAEDFKRRAIGEKSPEATKYLMCAIAKANEVTQNLTSS